MRWPLWPEHINTMWSWLQRLPSEDFKITLAGFEAATIAINIINTKIPNWRFRDYLWEVCRCFRVTYWRCVSVWVASRKNWHRDQISCREFLFQILKPLIANIGLLRKIYIDFKVGSLFSPNVALSVKTMATPITSSAQGSRENLFFNCCLQSISLEAQLHVTWSGRRIWKKKRSDHWSVDHSIIGDGINVFPPRNWW